MMPLAPERNTMCVPAKPKADFSIDFIVGNNNNKKVADNNNTSNSCISRSSSPPVARRGALSPPVARRGASSPLSARQASPPYSRPASPPRSPGSSLVDEDEDMHVRARLLGLQAATLPGAGALHPGLHPGLHPHHPLASPVGLCLPREPTSPTTTATPSPPHSPPHQMPFMMRGLYRPEPMLMPHQLHPHLQQAHHLMHPGHPGVHHPGGPPPGLPHGPHGPHGLGGPPKDSYPLYPWLLSRHGRIFPHRFPGVAGPDFGFLLHPFRKPKRIRTAFSPSQLLKLEHAFENNHYVVGAERKQVAQALGLSETQVKVWFQNRRTKHKRTEQEEEAKQRGGKQSDSSGASSSSRSSSSSSGQQQQPTSAWKEEADERGSPSLSHRPVDLSSHDDSSGMESES